METPNLQTIMQRHQYLAEKHIHGFVAKGDDVSEGGGGDKGDSGGKGGQGGGGKEESKEGGGGGGGGDGGGMGGKDAKRGHIDLGPLEEHILKKTENADAANESLIPELREVDAEIDTVKRELAINKDRVS